MKSSLFRKVFFLLSSCLIHIGNTYSMSEALELIREKRERNNFLIKQHVTTDELRKLKGDLASFRNSLPFSYKEVIYQYYPNDHQPVAPTHKTLAIIQTIDCQSKLPNINPIHMSKDLSLLLLLSKNEDGDMNGLIEALDVNSNAQPEEIDEMIEFVLYKKRASGGKAGQLFNDGQPIDYKNAY